jgi:hypothetical protein
MMGVAENISDLRDLFSIVAEETGALKMDDADEDSVGWTTEGPLPMTFGHVRRAHTALAALEAALSTDAEPVKTAPSVAVKALADAYQKYLDAVSFYNERHAVMKTKALGTMRVDEEYKAIDVARRAFDKLAVEVATSALSAQVQDVARDLPTEFEKWWEDAGHYVGGVVKMTYTQRKQLAWDAFYAAAAPAARPVAQ